MTLPRAVHRALAALAAVAGLLTLSGCSHDYWVRFQYLTGADPDVVVEDEQIHIPTGLAVAVEALPMRDEEELGNDIPVDLVSRRPNVLGVDNGLEYRQFVLYGVQPGTTAVDVYFEDNFIKEIAATVSPQAAP